MTKKDNSILIFCIIIYVCFSLFASLFLSSCDFVVKNNNIKYIEEFNEEEEESKQ